MAGRLIILILVTLLALGLAGQAVAAVFVIEGFFIRLNDEAGTDIFSAPNPKLDGAIRGSYNPGETLHINH